MYFYIYDQRPLVSISGYQEILTTWISKVNLNKQTRIRKQNQLLTSRILFDLDYTIVYDILFSGEIVNKPSHGCIDQSPQIVSSSKQEQHKSNVNNCLFIYNSIRKNHLLANDVSELTQCHLSVTQTELTHRMDKCACL